MSERIAARLTLTGLVIVFLVTGWLIHVRPANGLFFSDAGERVRLLLMYADVILVVACIAGGLAALFGLAFLIHWCLTKGWP